MSLSSKKIIIMASGQGSNAEKIIDYFKDRPEVEITAVLSNKTEAGVLAMAQKRGIKTWSFGRKTLYESDDVLNFLKKADPDLIVLAGFMWIIPERIVMAFPHKIINIHPALLPKYGGKGMYGHHVHRAVLDHQEKESGISIHYVNAHYDEGKLIAQFKTELAPDEDLDSLVNKIKQLEHKNYPPVIDQLLFPESYG